LVAELTKQKLHDFDITIQMENFKQKMKNPHPKKQLKQLTINIQLIILNTTIPNTKLTFEDHNKASIEAEISEKKMAANSAMASKAALKSAVKQAVEQAVVKLGAVTPPTAPKKPAKKKS